MRWITRKCDPEEWLLALLLTLYFLLIGWLTLGLDARSRLLPQYVLIVLLAVALLHLLGTFNAGIYDWLSKTETIAAGGAEGAVPHRRELAAVSWIAAYIGAMIAGGILPASLAVPFLFMKAYGLGWRTALLTAAGATAAIYLVFVVFLRIPLWRGYL